MSGEYAMIHHAAQNGAIDLRVVLEEVLGAMRRAGKLFCIFISFCQFI